LECAFTLSAGPNKTIEALIPEIRNEMSELRKEMKSLKENKTSETGK